MFEIGKCYYQKDTNSYIFCFTEETLYHIYQINHLKAWFLKKLQLKELKNPLYLDEMLEVNPITFLTFEDHYIRQFFKAFLNGTLKEQPKEQFYS